ncbi:MAG TPA: DUF4242 domain-containing protein [Burkholderiales bacterium]|nr:DUF4242 domain-containing protein [Burkholderiales bacterium]
MTLLRTLDDNPALGGWFYPHRGVQDMPLYLDVHNKVEGLTAAGVAEDHRKDLAVQHKHGVKYLRYWFDEGTGKVFCLVEAPSKEAATAVHREAHGFIADEIVEVKEGS